MFEHNKKRTLMSVQRLAKQREVTITSSTRIPTTFLADIDVSVSATKNAIGKWRNYLHKWIIQKPS